MRKMKKKKRRRKRRRKVMGKKMKMVSSRHQIGEQPQIDDELRMGPKLMDVMVWPASAIVLLSQVYIIALCTLRTHVLFLSGAGNILTVADDLLKNDGQKFLEMMEQLAERRMQREEEAAADVEDDSEEEEEEDGDEDEDDDEEDDEEDEDEEEVKKIIFSQTLMALSIPKVMTEEQKMEEGKRMFSIFAARMFEQRVLQAYREKVAQERQLQLLRELEDEDKLTKEKEQKKRTEKEKKNARRKYANLFMSTDLFLTMFICPQAAETG